MNMAEADDLNVAETDDLNMAEADDLNIAEANEKMPRMTIRVHIPKGSRRRQDPSKEVAKPPRKVPTSSRMGICSRFVD